MEKGKTKMEAENDLLKEDEYVNVIKKDTEKPLKKITLSFKYINIELIQTDLKIFENELDSLRNPGAYERCLNRIQNLRAILSEYYNDYWRYYLVNFSDNKHPVIEKVKNPKLKNNK